MMFQSRSAAEWGGLEGNYGSELLEATRSLKLPADSLTTSVDMSCAPARLGMGQFGRVPTNRGPSDSIRALDLVLGSLALLFFAPLMLLIGLAIRLSGPGSILFQQQRLGHGGRLFNCLKFRTMRSDAVSVLAELMTCDPLASHEWERTHKLRDDPRISRLGRFLRKTSLDELPQIFNVLVGDMSMVGPRPIVPDEAYRYGRHIHAYYAVRPGITGLWQISGRNQTTYRRRVACDVRYVQTRSAYRYVAIVALTIPAVLLGRGAY